MSVRRAESEIAMLRSEIEALHRKVSEAQARVAKLQSYIEIAREFDTLPGNSSDVSARRPSLAKIDVFTSAIKEILAEAGGRLHTSVLHERLLERGMDVGGTNPITNLSSILSRSGEFENERRFGWGLKNPVSEEARRQRSNEEVVAGLMGPREAHEEEVVANSDDDEYGDEEEEPDREERQSDALASFLDERRTSR